MDTKTLDTPDHGVNPQCPPSGAPLTDERIEKVLSDEYARLVRETGYNGGMGGDTWDKAAARAIEREVRASQVAGWGSPAL
jgi:hypothetical protein